MRVRFIVFDSGNSVSSLDRSAEWGRFEQILEALDRNRLEIENLLADGAVG